MLLVVRHDTVTFTSWFTDSQFQGRIDRTYGQGQLLNQNLLISTLIKFQSPIVHDGKQPLKFSSMGICGGRYVGPHVCFPTALIAATYRK